MISCCSGSLPSNSTSSVLKSVDKKTTPKRRNRTTQTPRTQIQHITKYSQPSWIRPLRLVFVLRVLLVHIHVQFPVLFCSHIDKQTNCLSKENLLLCICRI